VYNLGLNYYPEYAKRVEAVTEADIRSVAKKYLLPERMIVIAVGDRKVIEAILVEIPHEAVDRPAGGEFDPRAPIDIAAVV
jgi:zinc protease